MKYTKNKISLDLEEVINTVKANPSLIETVYEDKRKIILKTDHYKVITLDAKEFPVALEFIKEEIRTRPDPDKRVEFWECKNFDGFYSYDIEQKLLNARKVIKKPREVEKFNSRALEELCKYHSVNPVMGKLFINELRLDNRLENERARQNAKSLGLI